MWMPGLPDQSVLVSDLREWVRTLSPEQLISSEENMLSAFSIAHAMVKTPSSDGPADEFTLRRPLDLLLDLAFETAGTSSSLSLR